MSKIRAVIHDWDDTVTNSFETYSTWYEDFANFHGIRVPDPDVVRNHWGLTVTQIIAGVWPEHVDEIDDMFKKFVPSKRYLPKVMKGTSDVFRNLVNKGYSLGIISSGLARSVKRAFREQVDEDLNKYHLFFHTQEDTLPFHKPDPKVFDKGLEKLRKLGINKKEIIYVGDHIFDLKAAENVGIGFVAVTTGVTGKKDFLEAGLNEKLIIDSFLDIEKVLD